MNPQDLLAQLRPPDAPLETIGWWPPAPGWWILAALCLIGLIALTWRSRRRALAAKPWQQALAIEQANFEQWQMDADAGAWLQATAQLLKRCLRHREAEAGMLSSLNGQPLCDALRQYWPDVDESLLQAIAVEQYRPAPDVSVETLSPQLKLLIRHLERNRHA